MKCMTISVSIKPGFDEFPRTGCVYSIMHTVLFGLGCCGFTFPWQTLIYLYSQGPTTWLYIIDYYLEKCGFIKSHTWYYVIDIYMVSVNELVLWMINWVSFMRVIFFIFLASHELLMTMYLLQFNREILIFPLTMCVSLLGHVIAPIFPRFHVIIEDRSESRRTPVGNDLWHFMTRW